jgi:hypothetical protein
MTVAFVRSFAQVEFDVTPAAPRVWISNGFLERTTAKSGLSLGIWDWLGLMRHFLGRELQLGSGFGYCLTFD